MKRMTASMRGPSCAFAIGLGILGCTQIDPRAECEASCEEMRAERCNGFDGSEDCTVRCQSAVAEYDEKRGRCEADGCLAEYDTFYACVTSASACDATAACASEIAALNVCSPLCLD